MGARNIKINAFSIIEVIIVMSFLSILITIIFFSANRFQLNLKTNQLLMDEINRFQSFRSTLWYEAYTSDSVLVKEGNVLFYREDRVIILMSIDGYWFIKQESGYNPLNLASGKIQTHKEEELIWIKIPVILGLQEIEIEIPNKIDNANYINNYFSNDLKYE